MPMSVERAAAHQLLDEAVEAVIAAYGSFDDGQIITGHILIVAGTRMMSPDLDEGVFDPDDGDEQESVSTLRSFSRRGQIPHMTRGILESYMDRWRNA